MEEKKGFITGNFEEIYFKENPEMKPKTVEDKHTEIMNKLNEINEKLPYTKKSILTIEGGITNDRSQITSACSPSRPSMCDDIAAGILALILIIILICGTWYVVEYFIKFIKYLWG